VLFLSEAEQIAARINEALRDLKAGTLRFWGEWFGRPYDNTHIVIGCNATGDVLHIRFNEGENLHLWSPEQAELDHRTFRIKNATRVRWEWFAYGHRKTEQNLYFMDFTRTDDRVDVQTNIDWYTPNLRPALRAAAVDIV
jgi:hypothetical protein